MDKLLEQTTKIDLYLVSIVIGRIAASVSAFVSTAELMKGNYIGSAVCGGLAVAAVVETHKNNVFAADEIVSTSEPDSE